MVKVDEIAVVGAGDMGHGIAELAALHGFQVSLRDIDEDIVEQALDEIAWSLDKLAGQGEIERSHAEDALDRVTGTVDLDEALADADLVIEAVPEDLVLKRSVFADVEAAAPVDAVLATNTSTIRPTEIGAKFDDPPRLVAMHFFNPVLLMDLVEIAPSETATDDALATVERVAERMDKTPITLERDAPGFVTSRLISVWIGSAVWAMEAGAGSKEQIDAAMKSEEGFPMGPFELADYTGLDVGVQASEYISQRLGEEYAPRASMVELVEEGHLGKKTGEGFYEWEDDEIRTRLSPETAEDFDTRFIMALTTNEAARLIDESVADSEAIDAACRLGLAFPQGPLAWADEQGLDRVHAVLEQLYADTENPLAEPADGLQARVDEGKLGERTGEGFHEHEKS